MLAPINGTCDPELTFTSGNWLMSCRMCHDWRAFGCALPLYYDFLCSDVCQCGRKICHQRTSGRHHTIVSLFQRNERARFSILPPSDVPCQSCESQFAFWRGTLVPVAFYENSKDANARDFGQSQSCCCGQNTNKGRRFISLTRHIILFVRPLGW